MTIEPNYRRPWWLLVNKSPHLITTVREETHPGQRLFTVRGEPLVQGLAWLIWGPVGALAVILVLVGVAIALKVNEQGALTKGLFIAVLLVLPALAWGGVSALAALLSRKYVQAERLAETQECVICLDQNQGELVYWSTIQPEKQPVAFGDIYQAKVTQPVGARDNYKLQLVLETKRGPLILLNEDLGTQTQKIDLAQEIQIIINEQ